jgi:hypothetical protein
MSEIVSEAEDTSVQESAVHRKFREQANASLFDYLKSMQTETPIKVSVIRELPKTWEGRSIEGTLDSFEEPISEEEIRDMFGGGKYKLVIYTPSSTGSWQYATARKLKIAGDPKLDGLITSSKNNREEESPSVVRDAMRLSQNMVERAEERAARADRERYRRPEGSDQTTQLLMSELASLRHEMAAKDERLFNMATSKPESSVLETLFGRSLEGESARMAGLRQQTESELRMKNDMHKAEIDRLHQRYEDIAKRQDDQHKREIDNLIRSNDNQMTVMKASYDGQLAGYTREISHLDRQLTAAQKEIADLRSKKDKTLLDSMSEMAAMKSAFEDFGGGKEESGGALERIVGNVMGSPLLEGIAARVAGGPGAMGAEMPGQQYAQEEEPEIPVGRPVQMPDGRVIFRKADGTIMQIRKKEGVPAPTGEAASSISDEEIGIAMQFMESALAADANPAEFGRTARNLAPSLTSGPIQDLMRTQGVDAFLARVSKLNPNSALLSQHGKNWVRKVAAVLLES